MKYIKHILTALPALLPLSLSAQTAIEAINFTQQDMKGTARFMSMGGAFGALGGDLSTLSQNPAGIGVYRSSDIGITVDLDCQSAKATTPGASVTANQTKFLLNNVGAVFTLRLNSDACPNLNIGFTYNKNASFNRRYHGRFPQLRNSLSNYIAGVTDVREILPDGSVQSWTEDDLGTYNNFNPWNPNDGYPGAPWMSILGYAGYLITPQGNPQNPSWKGQWGNGTTGSGEFNVLESGGIDSYNIALGGNIANVLFWGMDFDIINFHYNQDSYWSENLQNAYVEGDQGIEKIPASWGLGNSYSAWGNGFNYKLGVIVKPIQELRLGVAFHTPTWYSLTEQYNGGLNYRYNNSYLKSVEYNEGRPVSTDMNFRSPWKLIASAAGVIGGKFIISADYEWNFYKGMRFSEPTYGNYGGWDYGYDWWDNYGPYYLPEATRSNAIAYNDAYDYINQDIKDYTQTSSTIRIGAEYRVTSKFSVRAGYSNVSSPISSAARDNKVEIYTSDTRPSFRFDNSTNYITCGLGYKGKSFYADAAYVFKHTDSTYHAYPSDIYSQEITSPIADVNFNQSQIVLSMGFRF